MKRRVSELREVDHRIAFEWDCPDCDALNFVSGVTIMMSDEEKQEMMLERGIDINELGDFMACPDVVTCEKCGKQFKLNDSEE